MSNAVTTHDLNQVVCGCNNITRGMIVKAIQEKGYTRREDLTFFTRAGASCGSCAQAVEDIVRANQPAQPAAQKVRLEPRSYPKGLDLIRIKKEGLELDLTRLREFGVSALSDDDYYRLKTYGVCGQKHPEFFMMRIRIPAGQVNADQLECLADLAKYYGRSWGHLTTRQDLELHWVRLERVQEIWQQLEAVQLTTRSACGHTLRNVMACPHSAISPTSVMDVRPWAKAVSDYFVSRSDWMNPALPNRINIYFAGCKQCAEHAVVNDIGFVAVNHPAGDGALPLIRFQLWAGGSLGTYPLLGFLLKDSLSEEEILPACQALLHLHMQFGGRHKGKTRLKFLIEELGRERFTKMFDEVFALKRALPENRLFPLPIPKAAARHAKATAGRMERLAARRRGPLPAGWSAQRQPGYASCVLEIPLGEIRWKQLAALSRIARQHEGVEISFNMDQNVELHWVREGLIPQIQRALDSAEFTLKGLQSGPRVVSCVGTQFCVLAVTNSQGAARSLQARIVPRSERQASLLRTLSIHISGCPNSCAKQQIADIGLAGGMAPLGDHRRYCYQLSVGGGLDGQPQLATVIRKGLTEGNVVHAVQELLQMGVECIQPGESFRGWVHRVGAAAIAQMLDEKLAARLPRKVDRVRMSLEVMEVAL